MELIFNGTITEVRKPRLGTTEKGEWASVEFEVTEKNPQNPQYPQVGLFDMFKNGDHVKFAKDFENFNPLGTEVNVHFNLKKNEYTNAKGEPAKFYKTSAWKVEKVGNENTQPQQEAPKLEEDFEEPLPF